MSDTKWTPGPWQEIPSEDSDFTRVGPIDDRGVMPFAVVSLHSEANARLIAAAPEMAAAIQMLIDSLEGKDVHPEEAIGACRSALAKAQGE